MIQSMFQLDQDIELPAVVWNRSFLSKSRLVLHSPKMTYFVSKMILGEFNRDRIHINEFRTRSSQCLSSACPQRFGNAQYTYSETYQR